MENSNWSSVRSNPSIHNSWSFSADQARNISYGGAAWVTSGRVDQALNVESFLITKVLDFWEGRGGRDAEVATSTVFVIWRLMAFHRELSARQVSEVPAVPTSSHAHWPPCNPPLNGPGCLVQHSPPHRIPRARLYIDWRPALAQYQHNEWGSWRRRSRASHEIF